MKVYFDVIDGVGLEFCCWECGTSLQTSEKNFRILVHPTEVDEGVFTTKNVPVECKHAGEKCDRPSMNL